MGRNRLDNGCSVFKHARLFVAGLVIVGFIAANSLAEDRKPEKLPTTLKYGDGKADGKKSYGGSGQMIRFELPKGIDKARGLRIHGSRYGYPQAPDEDFEITFLNEDRSEVLDTRTAPYSLFKRGKENWVRVLFKEEVELPSVFWVCLNFNAQQTKGVYVSYDKSTEGKYSRQGLPGDEEEPKETDFKGDWMVQVMLNRPER
jgi:RNA polymerase sigma-70 factor (ECF subfamily)